MSNFSIPAKLLVAFSLMVLLAVTQGGGAIVMMGKVNVAALSVGENWLPGVRWVGAMRAAMAKFRIAEASEILAEKVKEMNAAEQAMDVALETFNDAAKEYEALEGAPELKSVYAQFRNTWNIYLDQHKKMIALSRDDKDTDAKALFKGDSRDAYNNAMLALDRLVKLANQNAGESVDTGKMAFALAWYVILGCVAVTVLLAILIGGYIAVIAISRPIGALTKVMGLLTHGDLAADVPGLGRGDELGAMAQAVQVFKDNAIEKRHMDEAEKMRLATERQRQQESEELIDMFGTSVSGVFQSLSQSSQSMAQTAQSMKGMIDDTNTQIDVVSREVSEAESNAQAVAAASQELTAAIGEISRLINTSSQVAEQGSAQATEVVSKVYQLRDASGKIGEIVGIISNIATQTNLLALNATIEAARAGAAGKGFAVVAGEVKNLSAQTQKATVEIAAQITEIQNSIGGTVVAVQAIGETVTQIYRSSTEIAAAITEQQSATDEIARNIHFVSSSTEKIGQSMGAVRDSADKNNDASVKVHEASASMSGQADKLSVEVGDFLTAVKGAGTRHHFERLDTDTPARAMVGGQSLTTRAKQISIGGAWLDVRIDQPPGSSLEVTIEGIPRAIRARVAVITDKGTRLQFPMDSAHLAFMSEVIARLAAKAV